MKRNSDTVITHDIKPVSVDEFLNEARYLPEYHKYLNSVRIAGFTAYMRSLDKYYLSSATDFVPYLKKYLNIK